MRQRAEHDHGGVMVLRTDVQGAGRLDVRHQQTRLVWVVRAVYARAVAERPRPEEVAGAVLRVAPGIEIDGEAVGVLLLFWFEDKWGLG